MVRIPVGALLDLLGWKNKWVGNVGTLNHAMHVVTNKKASFDEVIDYTNSMIVDIQSNFDIKLEREVCILG